MILIEVIINNKKTPMSNKFKPPTIPLPEKSKKWNRPDMDGYVVFDSDIKRLEKKQARKLKIQKAKE